MDMICEAGILLGTRNTVVNKTQNCPAHVVSGLTEETDIEQLK